MDGFAIIGRFTKYFGLCGNAGILSGIISGFILMLASLENNTSISDKELFYIGFILTIFCYSIVLIVFSGLGSYTIKSIALPSFINSVLVVFTTVYITNYFDCFCYAWLLGAIIGLLIGLILCRINSFNKNIKNGL